MKFAGDGTGQFGGDGGPALSANLSSPYDIAFDRQSNAYIADSTNNRIRKVSPDGIIRTFAGTGTYGTAGDGGPALSAQLDRPIAIGVDSLSNVYVAGISGRVRRITPNGTIAPFAGGGVVQGGAGPALAARIGQVHGIAFDASDNVYLADVSGYVYRVTQAGILTTIAGLGTYDSSGDGGLAVNAAVWSPGDVAVDAAGNVYISESVGARVRRVTPTGFISTYAGTGIWGHSGDGGPASAAQLTEPYGLAIDARGNLLVGENSGYVRKISRSGTITTVAGKPYAGCSYTGDGGPATDATLCGLFGIAVDFIGHIYIAAPVNQVIVRVVTAAIPDGGPIRREETYGPNYSENRCQACAADPVNTATGDFFEMTTDLDIPGRGGGLGLTRSYNSSVASSSAIPGALGFGWRHNYEMKLTAATGLVSISQESGSEVRFQLSGGTYVAAPRVLATLTTNADGTWTFVRRGRERFTFSPVGTLLEYRDLNDEATTLSYDGIGLLTSVTDSSGRSLSLSYDTAGRVTTVADPAGRQVTYAYSVAGDLQSVVDVAGGVTSFTYDSVHRLHAMTDPLGGVTTNAYGVDGRVAAQQDPLGRRTTFDYSGDAFSESGGTTTITAPDGVVTEDRYVAGVLAGVVKPVGTAEEAEWRFGYDPVTLGVASAVDPAGHVTSATFDSAGNQLTAIDKLGRTTTMTYDVLNSMTSMTDPEGVTTTLTYDARGNLLSRSTPTPSGTRTVSYAHDDAAHPGDVTSVTDARGKTWLSTYDVRGYLASITDPLGHKTTFTSDVIGRRLSSVAPNENVLAGSPSAYMTTYTYDAFGRPVTVTDPLGHLTRWTYDAKGNVLTTTDANGRTTTSLYDTADQLLRIVRPDGTTVSKTYDAAGRVVATTDGSGSRTTYAYDNNGRLISTTDPLMRTTTLGYDVVGRRTSLTDAAGRVSNFSYDAAGQLTAVTYSGGTTPAVSFTYDDDGRRTSMTDGSGTTSYVWDSVSQLRATTNGAGASLTFDYDLAGHVTSITYPVGTGTVTRGYDDAGRWTDVTDWLGNTTTFGYDPNGSLIKTALPNGVVTVVDHDRADRVDSMEITAGTPVPTPLASFSYERDALGLVTSMTPTGVPQGPATYTYTARDEIASASGRQFGYDAAGNPVLLAGSTTQAFDSTGQLLSSATIGSTPGDVTAAVFAYDRSGNRMSRTTGGGSVTTYSYDHANRLVTVAGEVTASYAYDGDGIRVAKTVDGITTPFVWGSTGSVPLLLQAGSTSYVYGPGGQPIEDVADGVARFYARDAHGSTRLLTDSGGAVIGSFAYDVFGAPTAESGTATTALGFAGEYRDEETGFIYLRARYYDPATAQFVTRDPLVAVTGSPYGYVHNDPVNGVDPSGLFGWRNITKFVSDHAAEIVVGVVIVGAVVCAASVTCGVAVVGAFGPVGASRCCRPRDDGNDRAGPRHGARPSRSWGRGHGRAPDDLGAASGELVEQTDRRACRQA